MRLAAVAQIHHYPAILWSFVQILSFLAFLSLQPILSSNFLQFHSLAMSCRAAIVFISIIVIIILFTSHISPPPRTLAYHFIRHYPPGRPGVGKQQPLEAQSFTADTKVPLEIHIMSKCPDATDCLELLIAPALEEIEPLVDFQMSFIGRYFLSLSLSLAFTDQDPQTYSG